METEKQAENPRKSILCPLWECAPR